MKIPYGKDELYIALLYLDNDKLSDKKTEELINELEKIISEGEKDLNKATAEFHGISGISIEQFIASPKYKVLRDKYRDSIILKIAVRIREKLDITDKEAWALIAMALRFPD